MSSTIPDRIVRKTPSREPFGMLLLFAVLSALPIVLTLRLVEPALVLPALSLVLFAEAAMAALAARVIRVRASAANLTLWDSPVRSPLWGVQRRSSASRTKRRCSSKNRRRFVEHHDRNPRPGPSGSHKLRCRTGTQLEWPCLDPRRDTVAADLPSDDERIRLRRTVHSPTSGG